ncbi:MAG: alpha/beta hydrolase [bacterium]|nr:alpha/beta hydrolase [bacterium]
MSPLPSSILNVAGQRLEYVVENDGGSRPTLVFLHEGLGSVELWRSFPDQVARAADHRGLVYSRRGHGWSDVAQDPRPTDFVDREALDVLPGVVDLLADPRPILIGHSDGASIALVYAAHYPTTALVLLAPHVFVEEEGLAHIREIGRQPQRDELIARMARYHRDPATTFAAWNDVWLDTDFKSWNIEHVLGRIECPVLLIQGLDDQYGTLAQIDAVERQLAGPVRRVVFEDCDHSPHLAQPVATAEAAAAFIRDIGE